MHKIKITAIRKADYKDLQQKYENPIQHACDIQEGQVFIANGWQRPEGMCESAWESISPFVMKTNPFELDFDSYILQSEPKQQENGKLWQTAIGLQQVDGLTPSKYLYETAKK